MVNTLSGSVCAYRKETVKPRFIRIDEVMALLDVTQDEAMDIALAAGARYQLAKIILVHKERLMKLMKHKLNYSYCTQNWKYDNYSRNACEKNSFKHRIYIYIGNIFILGYYQKHNTNCKQQPYEIQKRIIP